LPGLAGPKPEPARSLSTLATAQPLARRYRGKLDSDANEFIGYAVDRGQPHAKAYLGYAVFC
jgi:hypothetical protein